MNLVGSISSDQRLVGVISLGVSPIIEVTKTKQGHEIVTIDAKGKNTFLVSNGVGVSKAWVDNEGQLMFTFTNEVTESIGMVVTDERLIDLLKKCMEEQKVKARIGEVVLLANAWIGNGNLYSQVVSIEGVTENSQVDLTPSIEQLSTFYEKDLTFVTENEGGVVTVYAIGQKPQNDYTIQVTLTEVAYE